MTATLNTPPCTNQKPHARHCLGGGAGVAFYCPGRKDPEAEQRAQRVLSTLAQHGFSASYEDPGDYPHVELHLVLAEKLAALLDSLEEKQDAAFQRGVHAGQESMSG